MKKFLNKIIFIILVAIFALLLMTIKSNAAKLSISTSKSTVSPGETFTVTVSVSGGAGSVSASVSNGSGGKTDFLDNSSFSFSCTAGNSGSVTIKANGTIADYTTEKDESKSATKTVTIKQPEQPNTNPSGGGSSSGGSNSGSTNKPSTPTKPTNSEEKETPKSSDSTLKSLSVLEGAISPEFNKDVREYKLTVPNEIGGANVTAIPTDSKATVTVTGNVGLKEGENTVTIIVVAEDGSSSKYLIRVTRARAELSLQSLVIKYKNQEGELVEILLNPVFNFQTYEYTLEDLEYWVEKLNIEAIANIEGATIDIQGANQLVEGENIVTITVKAPIQVAEGEELQEEIKTYTIKFNRKQQPAPPTLMGRISNWFNGIFGGVSVWYNQNQEKVVLGALAVCIVALIGLSIYIIADYHKYKDVIAKLKNINEMNKNEIQSEAVEKPNNIETIYNEKQKASNLSENIDKKNKQKGGRRFLD